MAAVLCVGPTNPCSPVLWGSVCWKMEWLPFSTQGESKRLPWFPLLFKVMTNCLGARALRAPLH